MFDLNALAAAIRAVESGSHAGNYGAIGPLTKKGNRAYGAYQVMDFNIPDWTESVLGQRMTPDEFLANPAAQDAVFQSQFGGYLQKYGTPEDAASVWFSGRPLAKAGNSSDGYNTVPQYVAKFQAALTGTDQVPAPGQVNMGSATGQAGILGALAGEDGKKTQEEKIEAYQGLLAKLMEDAEKQSGAERRGETNMGRRAPPPDTFTYTRSAFDPTALLAVLGR